MSAVTYIYFFKYCRLYEFNFSKNINMILNKLYASVHWQVSLCFCCMQSHDYSLDSQESHFLWIFFSHSICRGTLCIVIVCWIKCRKHRLSQWNHITDRLQSQACITCHLYTNGLLILLVNENKLIYAFRRTWMPSGGGVKLSSAVDPISRLPL